MKSALCVATAIALAVLLGGLLPARAAEAQQAGKVPLIGMLEYSAPLPGR